MNMGNMGGMMDMMKRMHGNMMGAGMGSGMMSPGMAGGMMYVLRHVNTHAQCESKRTCPTSDARVTTDPNLNPFRTQGWHDDGLDDEGPKILQRPKVQVWLQVS